MAKKPCRPHFLGISKVIKLIQTRLWLQDTVGSIALLLLIGILDISHEQTAHYKLI